MLKRVTLGVMFGLSMVPMVAMASTVRLSGNEVLVHVHTPGSTLPVV
jgi:hypothetical protein